MFKQIFLYMFNDNKFLSKYLLIFIFISLFLFCDGILKSNCYTFNSILNIVVLLIIMFLVHTIIIGYRITNIAVLNIENGVQPLPLLNLRRDFITGLKFQLAIFIFAIFAVYFVGGFGFLAGLSLTFNNIICNILCVLCIMSIILYTIYSLLFGLGFMNIYVKRPSYLILFKIKLLFSSIKNAPKKYILSLLFYSITTVLLSIFNLIVNSSNTIIFIAIVVVSSLLMTYLFFVNNYVIANCIESDNLDFLTNKNDCNSSAV